MSHGFRNEDYQGDTEMINLGLQHGFITLHVWLISLRVGCYLDLWVKKAPHVLWG